MKPIAFSLGLALSPAILPALLMISGCNEAEELDKSVSIKLDPALSGKEKALLRSDVLHLATLPPAPHNYWYTRIFGERQGFKGALEFLDTRINYILPASVEIDQRIKLNVPNPGRKENDRDHVDGFEDPDEFPDEIEDEPKEKKSAPGSDTVYAGNISTVLWLIQQANTQYWMKFKIGSLEIPILSTRVGIVRIGEAYSKEKTPRGTVLTASARTAALIHQGRHSDCTGGITEDELEEVRAWGLPSSGQCGHFHAICPKGHPYEGAAACDGHAWGAFGIEGVFASEYASLCAGGCNELQRQQAYAVAMDSYSRILIPLRELFSGQAGMPDLSDPLHVSLDSVRSSLRQFRVGRERESHHREVYVLRER